MRKCFTLVLFSFICFTAAAADYYWIGGSGNWSNISNWATTSGGLVTHPQAPTAADRVIFDENSFSAPNQVVTVDSESIFCLDMIWQGDTQGARLKVSGAAELNIFGSLQLSNSMTWAFAGSVNFLASTPGHRIDLAGQTLQQGVFFNGIGGAWELDGPLRTDGLCQIREGSLTTNSQTIICGRLELEIFQAGSRVDLGQSRIITTGVDPDRDRFFRASTVKIGSGVPGGLELSGATFQLNGPITTFLLNEGNQDWDLGAVIFTSELGDSRFQSFTPGAIRMRKLEFQNSGQIEASMAVDSLVLGGGQSFTFQSGRRLDIAYLDVQGNCQEPVNITTSNPGQTVTFRSDADSLVADYASIRDVEAQGSADFRANNGVDLGNNPGWTFMAKSYTELYWVGGTGMWDDPMHWSFTSGGPGGACLPTAGEDVIFDANSFTGTMDAVVINVENAFCRDFRWENPTGTPMLVGPEENNLRIFGALQLVPDMRYDFSGNVSFETQRSDQPLQTANHQFQQDVYFNGSGGWVLQDSFKVFRDIYFQAGALSTDDQYIQMRRLESFFESTRILNLSGSQVVLEDPERRNFLWWHLNSNNLTLDAGTSCIRFVQNGRMELQGSQEVAYHKVMLDGGGFINNYTDPRVRQRFDTLDLALWVWLNGAENEARNILIDPNYELAIFPGDTLLFDNMVVNGACSEFVQIRSQELNVPAYLIPSRPNQVNNLILQDIHNEGATPLQAFNSVDLGNNRNVEFMENAGRDLYWVGDGGEWSDSTHWSLSSGGPGGECPPGPTDNVFFDENSFSQPGQFVQGRDFTYSKDMIWTGAGFTPQFNFFEHQLFGELEFIDDMRIDGYGIMFRSDSSDLRINTRNHFFWDAVFRGRGSWVLDGPMEVAYFNYDAGDVTLNGNTLEIRSFSANTVFPKVFDFSGSHIIFTGSITEDFTSFFVNVYTDITTICDSSLVEFTSDMPELNLSSGFKFDELLFSNPAGSSSIFNFIPQSETDSITFNKLEIRNSAVFIGSFYGDTILFTPGKSYQLDPGHQLRGDEYVQIFGNNCVPIELKSRFPGQQADLVIEQGQVKADFVQMQDIRAVGPGPYLAGRRSTDISNNSNWIFDSAEEFVEEGFLGQDKVLCTATEVTLDANNFSPGETYRWQDGSTDSLFVVTSPGTYFVEVTFPANNCAITDSVRVLPPADFTPDLPDTTTLLCEGEIFTLEAGIDLVGLRYLWQDSSTSSSIEIREPGMYKVSLELDGCTASDSTQIAYVDYPEFSLGPDQTLCADSTLQLNATTDTASYRWQDGSSDSDFLVDQAGIYWVDVAYGRCATRDSIQVDYYAPVPLDLGPDTTICEESTLVLDASLPGGSYRWLEGSTSPALSVDTVGSYFVEAEQNGCPAYDTIQVFIQPLPRFDLGPDTAICTGDQLQLDGRSLPGTRYEWSTGDTTARITTGMAGTYALQATLNGCTSVDLVNVDVKSPPTVDLGPDQSRCEGDVVRLDVIQTGGSYLWQDGTTSGSYQVVEAGTYAVEVTVDGCPATDTINFTYNPLPRFDLGPDTAICTGEAFILDGTTLPGAIYAWSDGLDTPTRTEADPGLYVLQAELAGCFFSDSLRLDTKPLPTVDLGPDQVRCEGETTTLNVSQSGATYRWQDGSTGGQFTVSQGGEYFVVVNLAGCEASDSTTFTFNQIPRFELGNDTLLCEGETLILDGSSTQAGATYSWGDGVTGPNRTVDMAGTYDLSAELDGCSYSDRINVAYGIIPDDLLGGDRVLCEGETLDFNLSVPGASYRWQDGSVFGVYTIESAGTYRVEVNIDRCSGSDEIVVNYNPTPEFSLGPDTLLCEGSILDLRVPVAADSYTWQDGSAGPNFRVAFPGTFRATATLDNCSFTDEITVDYQANRSLSLGPDTTICADGDFLLSVNVPADRIRWQDGSSANSLRVSEAGLYSVEVRDGACTYRDSIRIDTRECFRFRAYQPTAFSPNRDGVNDEFKVALPPNIVVEEFEMEIFDRWGNRLFSSSSPDQGWDGLKNGEPMSGGVYIYRIRIKYRDDFRSDEEIIGGDVLLIR